MKVRPNKSHVNVNHLLRLNEKLGSEAIDDYFLHAQSFYIDINLEEYAKIIEYFQNNKFPSNYMKKKPFINF